MKYSHSLIIITTISLLHSITALPIHNLESKIDRDALLAIKSKIPYDPNQYLSSWNVSTPLCQWYGVTCGRRHGRVISLNLSSSNLAGKLSPAVGNLSFLHNLTLPSNTLQGEIPAEIRLLSRLRFLNLSQNSFQREIPVNLSGCLNLRSIDLSHNKLMGKVPVELSFLPDLKWLRLSYNTLSGSLEDAVFMNMTSLEKLALDGNRFEGEIPRDIGRLKGLITLFLGDNRLSGTIPPSFFNLSSLKYLSLRSSGIHGELPQDLGLLLPKLQYFRIRDNYLSGSVPKSLSNLSELVHLDISGNYFSGKFLFNGQNMQNLEWIGMASALTTGDEANDLSFIETLTNCSNLSYLVAGSNNFGGVLPNAIVNLSTSLRVIELHDNRISGSLPLGMSKFVHLYFLYLEYNKFTGPIPTEIGQLKSLEVAFFSNNNFSGNIPSSLGNLSFLSELVLSFNNLVGNLPSSLGNCKNLLRLYLPNNSISGVLPLDLLSDSQIVELVIGENQLHGSLPVAISNLRNLVTLDISGNMFSGVIPSTLGGCTSLVWLYLGANSFSGSIPLSFSSLKGLQYLDFTQNNLSGEIPSFLSDFPLVRLGLSLNNFEGNVPVNGVFSNVTGVSLDGNPKLCGGVPELHLPRCPKPKRRLISFKMIMIIISCGLLITAVVLALVFYFLCFKRKKGSIVSGSIDVKGFMEVSYRMLWEATEGFSPSNLIGNGGFGSVYKGIINQDDREMQVAVKVLKLQNERANKSMIAECKALRNIRHRNLVKIITVCSSLDYQRNDFKALVYEFMPRGSLDNWLHSVRFIEEQLSLFQRLSIVIDVACAIHYLHNECPTPIIHCDLKPSNILLDNDMTAHVGDFGLAKFLPGASGTSNQGSSSQVQGTVGYTPPEYGVGSKASALGDIYSFGIIVLETITSKKPTDPMFCEGLNLREFAKSALPDRVIEVIDPRLIDDGIGSIARSNADVKKMECIKLLISIGIQCSSELPQERMQMKEVVNQLKLAKQNLLGRRIRTIL